MNKQFHYHILTQHRPGGYAQRSKLTPYLCYIKQFHTVCVHEISKFNKIVANPKEKVTIKISYK